MMTINGTILEILLDCCLKCLMEHKHDSLLSRLLSPSFLSSTQTFCLLCLDTICIGTLRRTCFFYYLMSLFFLS